MQCMCPCSRRTQFEQGLVEGEDYVRCICAMCGRQGGGGHSCHYRILRSVAQEYGRYCFICQAFRHKDESPDRVGTKHAGNEQQDKALSAKQARPSSSSGLETSQTYPPALRLLGGPGDQGLALLLVEGVGLYRCAAADPIVLLRANYEGCQRAQICGFFEECIRSYFGPHVWKLFDGPPCCVPATARIGSHCVTMYGGYRSSMYTLEDLCHREGLHEAEHPMFDVVWSDAEEHCGLGLSLRWDGCTFGDHMVDEFRKFVGEMFALLKEGSDERLIIDSRVVNRRVGYFAEGGDSVIEVHPGSEGLLCDGEQCEQPPVSSMYFRLRAPTAQGKKEGKKPKRRPKKKKKEDQKDQKEECEKQGQKHGWLPFSTRPRRCEC